MLKMNLRKKILAGYTAMMFLMIIVGAISISQFRLLGSKVGYLVQDVGEKVRLANCASMIESSVLSLRLSVEKYIYNNQEKDHIEAEKNIAKLMGIIAESEKSIKDPEELKILEKIRVLSKEYIDKYHKVVIRYNARNKNKENLADMGRIVYQAFDLLSKKNSEDNNRFLHSKNASMIMSARFEMGRYMTDYGSEHSDKALKILENILDDLENDGYKEMEKIKYSVEDFMDEFEGVVAVTIKLNKEVNKEILPIAPKIVSLADTLSSSGWDNVAKSNVEVERKERAAQKVIALIILFAIVLGLCIGLISAGQIINPVIKVSEGLKDIVQGEGDLTTRLAIKHDDEVGELAKWFNVFIEKIQSMIKEIAVNAGTVNKSSTELSSVSDLMTSGINEMSHKTDNVTAAAGAMSSNMSAVAAATEQAATNLKMVAAAAEEMTVTISGIAKNSAQGSSITGSAVSHGKVVSEKVTKLGNAAQAIGKVVETITEIADQINLLALNATIEAARAGDSGKGFAVVANEIKELAKQTAESAGEIKTKIGDIQESTSGTVVDIGQIVNVINDVNEIVSKIATAVEEQSVTTKEIAENVAQASLGISEVTENVTKSSVASVSIADDISEVNGTASGMSENSSQVSKSSEELNGLASQLEKMVSRFKI